MAFIKVCSKCGTVNPANRTECSNCHKDLTREKKISEEKYRKQQEDAEAEAEKSDGAGEGGAAAASPGNTEDAPKPAGNTPEGNRPPRMVYICENCGAANDTQRSVCSECGDSLAGIVPVPYETENSDTDTFGGSPAEEGISVKAAVPVKKLFLRSTDGSFSLELSEGEHRLGRREEGAEYFAALHYVSGFHAVLTVENGMCFIEDFSSNGTYINGGRIEQGKRVKLLPEADLIGFGSHRTSDFMKGAAYLKIMEEEVCVSPEYFIR